jgi:hypothetical protein
MPYRLLSCACRIDRFKGQGYFDELFAVCSHGFLVVTSQRQKMTTELLSTSVDISFIAGEFYSPAGPPMPYRFLAGAGLVDRLKGQGYFDELFAVGH